MERWRRGPKKRGTTVSHSKSDPPRVSYTIGGRKTHNRAKQTAKVTAKAKAPPTVNKNFSQRGARLNRGGAVQHAKAVHSIGAEPENPRNGP